MQGIDCRETVDINVNHVEYMRSIRLWLMGIYLLKLFHQMILFQTVLISSDKAKFSGSSLPRSIIVSRIFPIFSAILLSNG